MNEEIQKRPEGVSLRPHSFVIDQKQKRIAIFRHKVWSTGGKSAVHGYYVRDPSSSIWLKYTKLAFVSRALATCFYETTTFADSIVKDSVRQRSSVGLENQSQAPQNGLYVLLRRNQKKCGKETEICTLCRKRENLHFCSLSHAHGEWRTMIRTNSGLTIVECSCVRLFFVRPKI